MGLLIKNGKVIDPYTGLEGIFDVLIEENIIQKIEKNIVKNAQTVINATNKTVVPGLVDIHVHFRDPGETLKEDIISGCKAAAAGGFTTVACMPNTNPSIDNEYIIRYIIDKAKKNSKVNVLPIGAITKGTRGDEICEIGKMKEYGICAISDDGKPVSDARILRNALLYSKMFNIPIFSHCECLELSSGGVMNEGFTATHLGLQGMPNVSESSAIARDILVANSVNASIHICHVSTKESVEIIRYAKKNGAKITCETAPHYFSLTDESVVGYNTNAKVNPPLRSQEDVLAVIEGLKDDTIDIIASDHAPHKEDDKSVPFDIAAFGAIGLETSLAVGITSLVKNDKIRLCDLIRKMTVSPSNLIKICKGSIEVGKIADITIFDENEAWIVNSKNFKSKSKNSPFLGFKLFGKVNFTIVSGKIIYQNI